MTRSTDFFRAAIGLLFITFFANNLYAQSFQITADVLTPVHSGKINWVDLDSDGDLDLLYSGSIDGAPGYGTFVYRNDNGAFTFIPTSLPNIHNGGFAWGDFDNDSDPDILVTGLSASGNISALYRNNGAFNFTLLESFPGLVRSTASWFDIDNDQDLDLLFAGTDESVNPAVSRTRIYENLGGTFQVLVNTNLPGCAKCAVEWADANNDGWIDVIFSGIRDTGLGRSTLHLNNGDKTFRTDTNIKMKNIFDGDIRWGDFDNDGDLDVLQAGAEQGNASSLIFTTVYENLGTTWKTRTDISLARVGGNWYGGTRWFDYDNDGLLDVLLTGRGVATTGSDAYFKIFWNSGNGQFAETFSLAGLTNTSVDVGDYDNDGDMDICFTGSSTNGPVTGIFRNGLLTTTSPTNTQPAAPDVNSMAGTPLARKQFLLSWDAGSDTESPASALGYNVYVRNDEGDLVVPGSNLSNGYRRIHAVSNAHGRKLILRDMPEGNLYWAVQSIDGGWRASDFSTEETYYNINGPQAIKAEIVSASSVRLFWSDNSLIEDNFVIHKSTGSFNNYALHTTLPANSSDYTDAGPLTTETLYYYRIFASNASNTSGFDSLVVVIPQSPINLVANTVSSSMISLTWTDRTAYETNYVVERKKSGDPGFTVIATLAGGKVSYNDQSLTPGTYYEYRVKAINQYGSSQYTLIASAVTNFRPTASDFSIFTPEDVEFDFSADVFAPYFSDPDLADDFAAVRIESLPQSGFMTFNGTMVSVNQVITAATLGLLRYTPYSDLNGDDPIQFRISDGKDYSLEANTLTITVLPVNDLPAFFFSELIEFDEDFTEPTVYAPFPAWPENENFETVIYSIEPASSDLVNISFDEASGTIQFTAVENAEGTASFTLTSNDGNAENGTFSQEFFVTVYPVNDAPVIQPITDKEFETDNVSPIALPVSDVDNDLSALQITVASDNQSLIADADMSVEIEGDDVTLTFVPAADQTGDATITVTVSDGEISVEETFVIKIVPVTGIEDMIAGKIEVFPNPSSDVVVVDARERGTLSFYNSLGNKVNELGVEKGKQTVSVRGFSQGIYLMKIVSPAGKVYVGKLIRN